MADRCQLAFAQDSSLQPGTGQSGGERCCPVRSPPGERVGAALVADYMLRLPSAQCGGRLIDMAQAGMICNGVLDQSMGVGSEVRANRFVVLVIAGFRKGLSVGR